MQQTRSIIGIIFGWLNPDRADQKKIDALTAKVDDLTKRLNRSQSKLQTAINPKEKK